MDLTVPKVTDKHSPTLCDFHDYMVTVTKEDALETIKNLAQMESEDWFRIGMVLSSFRKSKGDEEFKSLLHYAEQNFQINSRKAYYLISIHDNLVGSNITPAQVSSIGWTKLKEIAHLLTVDNVNYWVDICKVNTTKQILILLKSTATTNISKAGSIEDALAETPMVVAKVEPTIEPVVAMVAAMPVDNTPGIVVGYDFSKDSNTTALVTISDSVVNSNSDGIVVEPASTYYEKATKATPITYEPALVEMHDPNFVADPIVIEPDSAMTANQLASKLKVYPLGIVLSTITNIFPNIEITVSEAQNATSID